MVAEHRRLTVADFLAWAEAHPDVRAELIDGEIVAMAPELLRHVIAKGEAFAMLRDAIRAAGLPCRALADGAGVSIADDCLFIPDVTVECEALSPRSGRLVEPIIVVEVLSPSTRRHDMNRKLIGYTALESVQHYLVLDPETRTVEHFRRDGPRFVATLVADTLTLDPPGLTLTVDALFDGA